MSAQKTLIDTAYDDNENNYKFAVLSESCIPIQTPDFVYDFLTKDNLCYFSYVVPWFGPSCSPGRFYSFIPPENFLLNDQFFIISRDICSLVRGDESFIDQACKYEMDSESYIASFLSVQNRLDEVVNKRLTYVGWEHPNRNLSTSSPYTFPQQLDEYDRNLLLSEQDKGTLFARKFPDNVDVGFLY